MLIAYNPLKKKNVIEWVKNVMTGKSVSRTYFEWLQAYPCKEWQSIFKEHIAKEIPAFNSTLNNPDKDKMFSVDGRSNFHFSGLKEAPVIPPDYEVSMMTEQIYNTFPGTVKPTSFGQNFETFTKKGGIGFCVLCKGRPAALAFSAVVSHNLLEIAIETVDEFRRKGCARIACYKLLEYSLLKNFTPVWTCRKTNVGSVKLAESLGFVEKTISIWSCSLLSSS